MADDKKPKDNKGDKKGKDSGKSPSLITWFIGVFILMFIVWIITGGPNRNPEARYQPFISVKFW